ncbi:MAG: PIN domain-containing protein [Gammaproteobacteria bacterium]|nr:PIN domain-containing protein [Gammaproteobacteria bacterium]
MRVILDTGPLVALLNSGDRYHGWAVDQWSRIAPPLTTCEAVLAEACFLVQPFAGGQMAVLDLVRRGVLDASFQLAEEAGAVSRLLKKYRDVPMSLADGCLVRMAELDGDGAVLTLDSDFRVYRKNGRQVIPTLSPD